MRHTILAARRLCAAFALVIAASGDAFTQTTVDGFDPGASNSVRAIAVQPDGKVLVGGTFTKVGGGGFGNTTRNHIARLNADGSVDTSFNPGANNDVIVIAIQPDGKIVIGGIFTAVGGGTGTTTRNRIARLNADGSVDTGFNPGTNNAVQALALQPDGKIVVAGSFTMLGGSGTGTTTRNYLGRLNADGALDTLFNPGADDFITALAIQPDGAILVGGSFFKLGNGGTLSRTFFGRVTSDGSLDTAFNPGPNSAIYSIVLQSDNRIVVGGAFTTIGAGGALCCTSMRWHLARLSTAGVVESQFNPGADGNVYGIALQPDGKFVVGGSFSKVGAGGSGTGTTSRLDLARINGDGTVDTGFDPGANSIVGVDRIVLQADGKILVSGDFTQLGGGGSGTSLRNGIGRINSGVTPAGPVPTIASVSPSGGWGGGGTAITITGTNFQAGALVTVGGVSATSVVVASATTITATTPAHAGGVVDVVVANPDLQTATKVSGFTYAPTTNIDSFDPGANISVTTLALQSDGKIVVGGFFSTLGGGGTGTTTRGNIGRLNPDGTIDAGFFPGADNAVGTLVLQPDGRLLVGGSFTKLGGGGTSNNGVTARSRIGRLNADGTIDSTFNPGANAAVNVMALQSDGKILVGGAFTTLGGVARNRIGRVNPDGSIDAAFNPGASATVWDITVQPDGKILVGSEYSFSTPSAVLRRLNADGSIDAGFSPPVPSSGAGPFVVLPNGRILVAGYFATADFSVARQGIARLNANGSLDASFNTGTDGYFDAILPLPDGRIVVGGLFLHVGGGGTGDTQRNDMALLNGDGSLDTSFDVGSNGEVYALVAQSDGKVVAGGAFTRMGGGGTGVTIRNYLARFSIPVPAPTITLDRTSLQFSAVSSGAAFTSKTGTQAVRLTQSGSGTVTWTASSATPWLIVSPTSGTGSATVNVSVQFAAGLSATQTASIALAFTGASNTTGSINVTLNTLTSAATAAPTGSFDTPIDGATGVAGSIAVTGWAIDDVQVTRVRILRDAVAGEPAGVQVYIGDGVFIDGARPDVQAAFPNSPLNTRAGWGYLMLTNFLPSLGNGTFKLYAHADDADGHTTLIGTKTITCSNNTSIAPFGAIDTPNQGEVISGVYNNFGWALSPGARRADVPGGGTVSVLVDGVSQGAPGGWSARPDLTALFPAVNYEGVGNASAVFTLDTTALANGVHTIAWIVTATSGGTSGVGSRFFTVSNGSLFADPWQHGVRPTPPNVIASQAALTVPPEAAVRLAGNPQLLAAEIETARTDLGSVAGRRGFDLEVPLRAFSAGAGGVVVPAEELDRIELHLDAGGGQQHTGYLRTVTGLAPLPIGSMLDPASGLFTWMPGVGFVGAYDLVFARWSGGTAVARQDVRVVLNPKGSNRVGPQVIIDTPASAPTSPFGLRRGLAVALRAEADEATAGKPVSVGRSFLIAGWAIDLDDAVGTGVDTLHVWAYPASGEDPIFLGAATYGGARPDVAAFYGERFKNSGYGLAIDGLAPGTYDLAVFAWSTVTHGFVPAGVVRVTVK